MERSPTASETACTYSVVLPVFNEEACLEAIINRIEATVTGLHKPFEIICVNDGSTDATWAIIQKLHRQRPHIKGIKFSRNYGHQLAVYAGIKHSRGEYIAILDADGQDPPEELPAFFAKCAEGYDVVYAVRKKRKEPLPIRICYSLFYRFYRVIVPFNVPLDSGDFSVINRHVADFLSSLPEKRPFIRGLRSWYGGKQCGLEYERHARLAGVRKYSFIKLVLLALNAAVSLSKVPLRIIAVSGITISFLSFLAGIYLIALKYTVGIPLLGWTSTTILIIFFGGLQLFVLGIVGEYIGDIFDEVKNRPQFLVNETVGI